MKRILSCLVFLTSLASSAQLKFTYVNPVTSEITIHNYGAMAVDISTYRLCALFEYTSLVEPGITIVNGDFNLTSGEEVTFTWAASSGFNTSQSDLCLFLPTGDFALATTMVDFIQYGASGQGRENVANTAGLWTAGTFLTGTGPWYYTGDGSASGLDQWTDQIIVDVNTDVRINELDPDQPSFDGDEFIELYGTPGVALDGLVLVFFTGASDDTHSSYDLDGFALDENGFFVLGSATVPNVDMLLTNAIENGADAVALYVGDASSWPTQTPVSSANLVDAVVYGTEDAADDGLLNALTPGQTQLDDVGNSTVSFSRIPDGGAAFDLTSYALQDPTPGQSNVPACNGGNVVLESGIQTQCIEADNLPVMGVATAVAGDSYLFVLTDGNGLIISTAVDGIFDLDPLPVGTYFVYGLAYNGILDNASVEAGQPIADAGSDDCASLSTDYAMIMRETCNFCDGGMVSTTEGDTYVSLCADQISDNYEFSHISGGNADSYTYFITDADSVIIQELPSGSVDLNTLAVGTYYVYGVGYMSGLDAGTTEVGDVLSGIIGTGTCWDISSNNVEIHVLDCDLGEGCTRLFISEYIEGTSNNKAIEIYNPTPFPVDLSDYDLMLYTNGAIDFTAVAALSGTIQPGDVYVIANSQADPAILAEADQTGSIATFSGNDALVLAYNLIPIDVFGVIGEDPGTDGWIFGQDSTSNIVLVRHIEVNSPTTNWALSQGQWTAYGQSDYSHLGNHNAQACSGEAFVSFETASLQVDEDAGIVEITINAFNVSVDVPITVSISSASATDGVDFTSALPQTLTFTPANNSQVITIEIIDDLEEEDLYEYITITLNDDDDLATLVNESLTISISPSDQDYPLYPIGIVVTETFDGMADSLDVFCSITGVVHGINFNPAGTEFTLIDATGGIKVFDADESFGYTVTEGDSVTVFGQITQFMGMTEMFPDEIIYIDGGHPLENPTLVTSLTEANESHMVTMNCVELVDPTQWTQEGSGFDVDVTDGVNTFVMHIDLNTDIFPMNAPEGHFSITGIGGQVDDSSPYDGGYVFWPRYMADMTEQLTASFEMPAEFLYDNTGLTIDFVNNSVGATAYSWTFGDGAASDTQIASHLYSYEFLSTVAEVTVTLEVENGEGCLDTFTLTSDVVFNQLEEISQVKVEVYPNPTESEVVIKSLSPIDLVVLFDLQGRELLRMTNLSGSGARMDLRPFAEGTYVLEITGRDFKTTERVIRR